jgi:hypothetical protein
MLPLRHRRLTFLSFQQGDEHYGLAQDVLALGVPNIALELGVVLSQEGDDSFGERLGADRTACSGEETLNSERDNSRLIEVAMIVQPTNARVCTPWEVTQ